MSRKNFEIPEKKVNITTRGRRTWPQGGVRVDVEPVQGTGNLSGLIAASWQDATASSSHDKGRMKLEFLFDSLATELRRASVANRTVTQDTVFVRFVGAAHTDRIAVESTGEPLQLRLPWDVWIAHATNQRKGRVYKTREGGISRSHSAVVLVATTIHVVRPNSKQHGALAVLAGQRFLVEDEDSTIRQFRQHAVRRHVAVSLGFLAMQTLDKHSGPCFVQLVYWYCVCTKALMRQEKETTKTQQRPSRSEREHQPSVVISSAPAWFRRSRLQVQAHRGKSTRP